MPSASAPVEVRIDARRQLRLLPDQRVDAGRGLPVELHQVRPAGGVHQPEGVHPEALHGAERAGNGPIGHRPHHVVGGLGVQRDEVPERVVRRLRLGDLPVRPRFAGVDQVGELDRVLDEEDRHVVADQVEVAGPRVELGGETAHVPHGVGRSARAQHRGEAHEHRSLPVLLGEEVGDRQIGCRAVAAEGAVRRGAPGVYHPFRDALVVEVGDLLPQVEVVHQGRTPVARLERMVGVRQAHPFRGGQILAGAPVDVCARRRAGGGGVVLGPVGEQGLPVG